MQEGILRNISDLMKKLFYFILTLTYTGIGILGLAGNDYMEIGGTKRIINDNLVLIIPIALIVGSLSYYPFINLFPKGHEKLSGFGKKGIPIVFVIISFVFTIGGFLFVNSRFGKRQLVIVNGVIERKWQKRIRNGNEYYIGIRDTVTGNYYEFVIKRRIYEQTSEVGDKIFKDFYKGSLGVMYR
jgi:hypothetical protein